MKALEKLDLKDLPLVGNRVRVADEMPPWMAHFPAGFTGIVKSATMTQGQVKYALIRLDDDDKPVDSHAWYPAELLTVMENDQAYDLKILTSYLLRD